MRNSDTWRFRVSHKVWFGVLLIGTLLMNSCVTPKKITYLQVYPESKYSGEYVAPETYKIQPNDNLYIRISTPDPRLSDIFNPMPQGSTMRLDEGSATLMSYPVQLDSTVEIPYIGAIAVAGKTLSEANDAIKTVALDYVSDVSVTVRLVNNYVSILGEVRAPGMYPIYKERLTIFQALAMAGDMDIYSDRFQLSLIRPTGEGTVVKEFDLTDKNIVDSEFYYVMPNDVIYAKPMKGKFFALDQFTIPMILSTITTSVSLFILIQNIIILQQPQ